MAGTGLALTGVLWGADKVPDHWFEKIPIAGDLLFKERKEREARVEGKQREDDSEMRTEKSRSTSRRYSDDEYEDDRSTKDERDKGYQSDNGHRRRNGHTRFDGGRHGTEDLDSPSGSRRSRDGGARRSGSGERYGYGDGLGRRGSRMHNEPVSHQSPVPRYGGPLDRPPMGLNTNNAPAVGSPSPTWSPEQVYSPSFDSSAFPASDPRGPPPTVHSTSTLRGGISTGYVPYAHLYGGPTGQQQQHNGGPLQSPPPFSPHGQPQAQNGNYPQQPSPPFAQPKFTRPETRHRGSPPPNARPVAPRPYHQNPLAQEAPPGNQPGYLVSPTLDQPRNSRDRDYDHRDASGYEAGNERQQSPPRRHDSRRAPRSRSYSRTRSHSRNHSRERALKLDREKRKEKEKPQRQKSLRDRVTGLAQSVQDKVSEFSSEFSSDRPSYSSRRRSRDGERRGDGRGGGKDRRDRRASQPARSRVSYDS